MYVSMKKFKVTKNIITSTQLTLKQLYSFPASVIVTINYISN
jgi:hypothetical protein